MSNNEIALVTATYLTAEFRAFAQWNYNEEELALQLLAQPEVVEMFAYLRSRNAGDIGRITGEWIGTGQPIGDVLAAW